MKEFIVCLGYKEKNKEYFLNYDFYENDFEISLKNNKKKIFKSRNKNFKITLVDTGQNSNTGERLKRIEKYIKNKNIYFTYGEGVGKIEIDKLYKFHKKNSRIATMTLSHPSGRWGVVNVSKDGLITSFREKASTKSWVNSGFFVLHKDIFRILKKIENPIFENRPLEYLAKSDQLMGIKMKTFATSRY